MVDFHIVLARDGSGLDAASALRYAALAGIRFAGLVIRSGGDNFSEVAVLAEQVRRFSLYADVEAGTGVELCHVPPALLPSAVREARDAGAELVLVYGETIADQVAEGTNFAAVEAGADIITHPGLVDAETATFAAERGVALELTSCPRHALTNARTAAMAMSCGCPLVRGSAATCDKDTLASHHKGYGCFRGNGRQKQACGAARQQRAGACPKAHDVLSEKENLKKSVIKA